MRMSTSSRQITLIKDYRGAFWSSTRNRWTFCSMDIGRLCQRLTQHHLVPSVVTFAEAARDIGPHWKDRLVVYQSAEDPNLEYRAFVEDVVLGLEVANARLLPRFPAPSCAP